MTKPEAHKPQAKCPICQKTLPDPAVHQPFCSSRCKQIDLGRWMTGDYVISRPIEQADLEASD